MGYCDYGHEATDVRRLPIGEQAGVFVCRDHYAQELEERAVLRAESPEAWTPPERWFPDWDSLEPQ